jgi:hypothetical protein
MRPWPRYTGRALPAQAYVPGRADTSGRPGRTQEFEAAGDGEAAAVAEGNPVWQRHPAFLWGLDLYNHGYPWEAHEAWEALWRQAPRPSAVRDLLQALIQCAAAAVHAAAGRPAGQRRLAERALARLGAVHAAVGPRCLGIDVAGLAQGMRAFALAGCAGDWPRIALAPETAPEAAPEAIPDATIDPGSE